MGLDRWVKHMVLPSTFCADAAKNVIDEGNIVDGIKKTVEQECFEDNPMTASIYKAGKFRGEVEGYVEASDEYGKILLEQADLFLQQKKDFQKERDEYEELLDAYDRRIGELQSIVEKTQDEEDLLQKLLHKNIELKKIDGR